MCKVRYGIRITVPVNLDNATRERYRVAALGVLQNYGSLREMGSNEVTCVRGSGNGGNISKLVREIESVGGGVKVYHWPILH